MPLITINSSLTKTSVTSSDPGTIQEKLAVKFESMVLLENTIEYISF